MTLLSTIKNDPKFKMLLFGVFVALLLEASSLSGYKLSSNISLPIALLLIVTIGKNVLVKGFDAIKKMNFKSINFLMTVAAIGAIALGEYEEAAVVIVLFSLAEKLEDFGFDSSKHALKALLEKAPKVVLLRDSQQSIPVEQVKVGDVFVVKTGDLIPLDGKIVKGASFVDESTITGEPLPKEKEINDLVFASTLNQSGYIEVECTKTIKDSTVSKIVELALTANQTKADVHQFVQNFAKTYVPIVLISTLLVAVIPPLFFNGDYVKWIKEALSILVISCPCALVISTPISIYCGITNATKRGAIIKGGKYLELMGRINSIALDKTRTITLGKPQVNQVIPFRGLNENEVLSCAAGIENLSEHPLAKSVVDEASARKLAFHEMNNFESVIGKGVQANCKVCSDKVMIGKSDFINSKSSLSQTAQAEMSKYRNLGMTPVLMADSRGEKGIILLSDQIKSESKQAIAELNDLNIHVSMLTGDSAQAANVVAATVNIKDVKADLLPEDKLKEIISLKQKYKNVAMVGDGVNDAPALARSSLGISMGAAGSDAAIETSNVAILNDRLDTIPYLIRMGRKTLATIKFNTVLAIGIKFLFLGLAVFGHSNLVMAIFADVGLTLFVVMNSLRLLQYKEVNALA